MTNAQETDTVREAALRENAALIWPNPMDEANWNRLETAAATGANSWNQSDSPIKITMLELLGQFLTIASAAPLLISSRIPDETKGYKYSCAEASRPLTQDEMADFLEVLDSGQHRHPTPPKCPDISAIPDNILNECMADAAGKLAQEKTRPLPDRDARRASFEARFRGDPTDAEEHGIKRAVNPRAK